MTVLSFLYDLIFWGLIAGIARFIALSPVGLIKGKFNQQHVGLIINIIIFAGYATVIRSLSDTVTVESIKELYQLAWLGITFIVSGLIHRLVSTTIAHVKEES